MAAPFAWMLLTSLQPDVGAVLSRPLHLPWPPSLGNYAEAWRSAPFGAYTLNSFVTSTAATLLQVLNAVLCAYAFTNLRFPGRNLLFTLVLAVLMIPSQVAIVPSYLVISRLGWLDTLRGLIVPFAVDAFGVFLVRQAFLSIPDDYAEAARIEGAGHLRIAFSILAGLARPSLLAYAIMAFKWRWNDYLWVLLMTTKPPDAHAAGGRRDAQGGGRGRDALACPHGRRDHRDRAARGIVCRPPEVLHQRVPRRRTEELNGGRQDEGQGILFSPHSRSRLRS